MKIKTQLLLVLLATVILLGLEIITYLKTFNTKNYAEMYRQLNIQKSNLILTKDEDSKLSSDLNDLQTLLSNKSKSQELEEQIIKCNKSIETIELTNTKLLESKKAELDKISTKEFNDEQKKTYDEGIEKYNQEVESKEYLKASATLDELIKQTKTVYDKIQASKQPKVMTNAFKLVSNSTKTVNHEMGIYKASGKIKNLTNFKFSKVVIIYDLRCTDAENNCSCGDFKITMKNVKPNETRSFSKQDGPTTLRAQYGGDKIKFKSIKAYK